MAKQKLPKSINLLEAVNSPEDVWEKIYSWLFRVGKYILIVVQITVLGVFGARFAVDRTNNDLTDDINSKVATLENPFYRNSEIKYGNIHRLLLDSKTLSQEQDINSTIVSSVIDGIPVNINLQRFSYSRNRVSLSFTATNFENIQKYEALLKSNPAYSNIKVNLTKSGDALSEIDFSVSFEITPDALRGGITPSNITTPQQ